MTTIAFMELPAEAAARTTSSVLLLRQEEPKLNAK
jgi:hypothetical protein